jgi:DNA (cytosine-5)-methyltransferase 1
MKTIYSPTANSYFSGAGLMDIGLMQAGVKINQSIDLDKRATAAMKRNPQYFNHKVIRSDVKEMLVTEQPQSDMMVFTWPCKKYSTIADIHGVRTGDELFLHAFRHVAIGLPEMFVVENVPGMKKFKVVMEAFTKIPNYYINVFCPVNASLWLPQQRERLIIIATKRQFNIESPERATKIPTVKDLMEKEVSIKVNESVIARIKGSYRDKPIIVDPEDISSYAPTCVAHYAKDMGTRLVKDKSYKYGLRPFTIREYARLQGVPDDYHFEDKNYSYELIGNGVAVPKARWIGQQAVNYFN